VTQEGESLASHLAAELRDPEPAGFRFDDLVLRQDEGLRRLAEQLSHEPEAEVAEALGLLLEREGGGWVQLKLLELCDRLAPLRLAPALLRYLEARASSDEPGARFLAGRAGEVLLGLPLDLETRARAQAISAGPMREAAELRAQAARSRSLHRPRRAEWAILVAAMLLGLCGLVYALQAVS